MLASYILFLFTLYTTRHCCTDFCAQPRQRSNSNNSRSGSEHDDGEEERQRLVGADADNENGKGNGNGQSTAHEPHERRRGAEGEKERGGRRDSAASAADNPSSSGAACWANFKRGLSRANSVINFPTDFVFRWTIPTFHWSVFFLVSLLWIFALSFALMTCVQFIGCVLGVDQALAGLLILSVGASLPDAIAMGVVARRGHGAMSLSGLVGSNIFDILVGLGFPWFLYNLLHGPFKVTSHSVFQAIVFAVSAVTAIGFSFFVTHMEIRPSLAVIPSILYVVYLLSEILL